MIRKPLPIALLSAVLAWLITTFLMVIAMIGVGSGWTFGISARDLFEWALSMTVSSTGFFAILTLLASLITLPLLRLPPRHPVLWQPRWAWIAGLTGGFLGTLVWIWFLQRLGVIPDDVPADNVFLRDRLRIFHGGGLLAGVLFATCHSFLSTRARAAREDPRFAAPPHLPPP